LRYWRKNTSVFFLNSSIEFPDFIHEQQKNPQANFILSMVKIAFPVVVRSMLVINPGYRSLVIFGAAYGVKAGRFSP
jgi:hypothetical protein